MKIFLTTLALISFVFRFEIKAQQAISDCPASPYAIEISQPDDTKISIIGKGSMKNSWTESLDGYTIVKNREGVYEYAQKENDRLIPSGFLVQEDKKNADKENFLDKQGKHLRSTTTAEELSNARITGTSAGNDSEIDLAFPTQGTHKVLVLLIDYPDLTATHTVAEFENFMNEENYNDTGSFRDYYLKVSDNKLDVNADVVGWYRADSAYEYYGKKNGYERTRGLAREAVDAAEAAGVDFSIYDNDEDGYIDGIILVHAGQGAEEGSLEDYIWSHRSSLGSDYYRTYDDIIINDYMVNPERRVGSNSGAGGMVGIGVFCHEFGHGLNLPDLYDIDYSSAGVGTWGLMAGAGWLGDEKVPGFMSAWSRVTLGWITPEKISSGAYALAASTTSTVVYKVNTAVPGEYFLLENRQQSGQDAYLKGSGLAIWHIDDNRRVSGNSDNADESHRLVDLEQADGLGHLYDEDGRSDDGDLFPGSAENTSFTDITSPNSKTYDSSVSGIEITEITEASGVVNFTVSGGDTSYDPVNVIFSLDLTNYSRAQTPPYIYGEWDSYCTNCNLMTDADEDGIWTDTISMGRGDYKFIFLTGVAFQTGTDYESFDGVLTSCNVLAAAGSVFSTDHYFRTLEVTGATENYLYGGTSVEWNVCPADLPEISIATDTTKVLEGDSIKVYVAMTQSSTDTVKIDVVGSGSAVLDKDYSMDARVIILPGDTTGFVMVKALDNDIYTLTDKSLAINISNILNATASSTNAVALSIMNNDAAPNVTLEVANGSVNEGDSIQFKAKISWLSEVATQIVFGYAGTALKGTDYDVLDSMAISPGDTMGMITIHTNKNNLYELDKNILVTISGLTHATSETGVGIELTIVNIDEAPTLSVTSDQSSIDEGDSVILSFNLSTVSGISTSIDLSLSGTAESADYTAPSTSITILAGDLTKTWTIVSIDDEDYETEESLVISFDTEDAVYNEGDLTITLLSEDLLGVSEQMQISFYPNPTTGMLSLEMINFKGLIIYDLSGKKLMQSNKSIIDISQLKKGTYILEASDKSGRHVKSKILKN